MDVPPRPISELFTLLETLDGQSFGDYRKLLHTSYYHSQYQIHFVHIQGSPGAFPASMCHLTLSETQLGIEGRFLKNSSRKIATADFLLRAFDKGVRLRARQNRGAQGSGSFQPIVLPPQVLPRNLIRFSPPSLRISFYISLPGSHDNRILGRQAASMFDKELDGIVDVIHQSVTPSHRLAEHCDIVEDMVDLQTKLRDYGLVAFVGDGAILPRQSGISQAPLDKDAVPCEAPDSLAVEVDLPNAGRVRGLGIRPGVNVVIGGAYHGKSTLLDALAKGIYPHIPGDGREQVVSVPDTKIISSEEGRSVRGVDISGFMDDLPGQVDTSEFFTNNASGSTSEAASIVEAVNAGATLLLIDEDSSATNFLIKDQVMRRLIPEDGITPFFDRVQELYRQHGVSTMIVVGGSSEYLGVANNVIAMRSFRPVSMTDQALRMSLPKPSPPSVSMAVRDHRQVLPGNFDPSYLSRRLGKSLPVRIKPLRLQEKILEYGNQQLDLSALGAVVDPHQMVAIGYALLLARKRFGDAMLSPSDLASALDELIEKESMDVLLPFDRPQLSMARPRRLELAAAINRIRNLQVKTIS